MQVIVTSESFLSRQFNLDLRREGTWVREENPPLELCGYKPSQEQALGLNLGVIAVRTINEPAGQYLTDAVQITNFCLYYANK